jgi:OOP family OmpA-OmpF porin
MKLTSKIAIAAVVSGTMGQSAQAQLSDGDWDYRFNSRFYIGLGAGISTLEPDTGDDLELLESEDTGSHVVLGWDFSRRLALELQYTDLGEAELSDDGIIGYTETSLSGLFYLWNSRIDDQYSDLDGLDLREGFSLFGKLGVGQMENEANLEFTRENDVQLVAGIGVEYAGSSGFAIRAEYTSFDTDAKYASLGLLYRFGGASGFGNDPVYLPELPAPSPRAEVPAPSAPLPSAPTAPAPSSTPAAPSAPQQSTDAAAQADGADSDGDGVADLIDDCANSAPGARVNEYGCEAFGGTLEGVTFLSGSDTLTAESRQILSGVAERMRTTSVRVSVEAHTDGNGEPENNLELSRRRAIAVVRYLVGQGIELDRFKARAFGESRPIASNDTVEGRRANRRVELNPVR